MAERDLSRSKAVLIGNAAYHSNSGIPALPAAVSSVRAMADLLTGNLCGWPTDRVVQLIDVATTGELARSVVGAIKDAQDVVLLYYVGHGLRTPKGQLALTLSDSDADPTLVRHTAMLYEDIADILRGCPAVTKLVILDCCHAELGNRANYIFQSSNLAEIYPVDGLYFIGASKMYEKAKTPAGGSFTYFTQNLIETVRQGIPSRSEFLRLEQIFTEIRRRMISGGLPEPVESGTRGARRFLFARNAAPAEFRMDDEAPAIPESSWANRMQHARILASAERAAQLITSKKSKALALADIASALAATDLSRADRLIVDAESTAQSITDNYSKKSAFTDIATAAFLATTLRDDKLNPTFFYAAAQAAGGVLDFGSKGWVLAAIAEAAVVIDPARAERVARTIADPYHRVSALAAIAEGLQATDRALANRLIADAECAAQFITDQGRMAPALVRVAKAAAVADPPRVDPLIAAAESAVQSITGTTSQVSLLIRVAKATAKAAMDPSPATRIISHESWKAHALADIASAMAASDPAGAALLLANAENAAQSITSMLFMAKVSALVRISEAMTAAASMALAEADPDASRFIAEAERIAESITDKSSKAVALVGVAKALTTTDPKHARQLIIEAERAALSFNVRRLNAEGPKAKALTAVAEALAATDPDRAERVARSILNQRWKAQALARVAAASINPARVAALIAEAERIACSVGDEDFKGSALAAIAEAIAGTNPDSAESIAHSITDKSRMVSSLVCIATTLAAADPDLSPGSAPTWTERLRHGSFIANLDL